MLIFTHHALKRMRERGISKKQVATTIQHSESAHKENDNITVFIRKFDSNTLEVVTEVNDTKIIIITLYWI